MLRIKMGHLFLGWARNLLFSGGWKHAQEDEVSHLLKVLHRIITRSTAIFASRALLVPPKFPK